MEKSVFLMRVNLRDGRFVLEFKIIGLGTPGFAIPRALSFLVRFFDNLFASMFDMRFTWLVIMLKVVGSLVALRFISVWFITGTSEMAWCLDPLNKSRARSSDAFSNIWFQRVKNRTERLPDTCGSKWIDKPFGIFLLLMHCCKKSA